MAYKNIKYTDPRTGSTADFSEYKNLPTIRVTAPMPPVKPPKPEPTTAQSPSSSTQQPSSAR
ncbi:MAG: hypothetical protein EAZ92_09090 [Candidatus Kapaibacterium sp.]|nr:MAG: hypothetical protein EAZ92_09090 [Candidatus Kapabacteria bacterium]